MAMSDQGEDLSCKCDTRSCMSCHNSIQSVTTDLNPHLNCHKPESQTSWAKIQHRGCRLSKSKYHVNGHAVKVELIPLHGLGVLTGWPCVVRVQDSLGVLMHTLTTLLVLTVKQANFQVKVRQFCGFFLSAIV
eukprot:2557351-Amphidinium_carterae.1